MKEKIMSILMEVCCDSIIYQNADINLFENGLLDSMGLIELLFEIEEEFEIEIYPSDIKKEKLSTPNQIIVFVEDRCRE